MKKNRPKFLRSNEGTEGKSTTNLDTIPRDGHAEFEDTSEFAGALAEAESNPSPLGAKLLGDLADYCRALPRWRQEQLVRNGFDVTRDVPVKLQTLLNLCLNLASIKATREFRLSYAEAADALRLSKTRAWAWLHLLESANILICVSRGNWRRRLSTTYRFAETVDVAGQGDATTPF